MAEDLGGIDDTLPRRSSKGGVLPVTEPLRVHEAPRAEEAYEADVEENSQGLQDLIVVGHQFQDRNEDAQRLERGTWRRASCPSELRRPDLPKQRSA